MTYSERAREVGVVRRVRVQVEEGERSAADLVRDPARLFVAPVVDAIALQPAERVSAASSALPRSTQPGLPSGGDGVAAEERGVERHAGLQASAIRPADPSRRGKDAKSRTLSAIAPSTCPLRGDRIFVKPLRQRSRKADRASAPATSPPGAPRGCAANPRVVEARGASVNCAAAP